MLEKVRDKLLSRCQFGLQAAKALESAILAESPPDIDELAVLAYRIKLCNSPGNQWYAADMHTKDGEAYDGSGRFWQCCSKLCSNCLRKESARRRKQINEALADQKLLVGENYEFCTFTIKNPSLSLLETRRLLYRAWSLFRKLDWFKRTIIGYARSEEFTLTDNGFHYHLHTICRAKRIDFQQIRSAWTECVITAFKEQNVPITVLTSDGLLFVNVQRVTDLKTGVYEVAKYITKSDTWDKLRPDVLLEIARIKRYPRSFALGGSFSVESRSGGRLSLEGEDHPEGTILDKKNLSDGGDSKYWRDRVRTIGAGQYLEELLSEIIDTSAGRIEQLKWKYGAATFFRLKPVPEVPPSRYLRWIRVSAKSEIAVKRTHDLADLDERARRLHAGEHLADLA